jgi:3-deoxy-D-arabino-heptulosonate 7-phosphate (DAHP) synthase class II
MSFLLLTKVVRGNFFLAQDGFCAAQEIMGHDEACASNQRAALPMSKVFFWGSARVSRVDFGVSPK